MSFTLVTSFAPFCINELVPIPNLLSILLGIENTFFPCLKAKLAVIVLPLLYPASITNTPKASALIISFLLWKFFVLTFSSGGYSDITHPLFYNSLFSFGYILLNPAPKTAIVLPTLFIADMCEIESIPIANPLIIHIPF